MIKILYLSPIDWFWIKQRPQHTCEGLSKKYDVTFFCKQSWRGNQLNYRNNSNSSNFCVKLNLKIIRKRTFPFQKKLFILKKANQKHLTNYLTKLNKLDNYDIVIITDPNDISYLQESILRSKLIIYDCMDNYANFPGCNTIETTENEEKLIKFSDIIIVSSNELLEVINKYDENATQKTYVINNGVDLKTFNIESYINKCSISEASVVSYVGTISEWVDLDLVAKFANKNKNVIFDFYGPIDKKIDINKYNNLINVRFKGVKPYNEIPTILSHTDVAIMPFKLNNLVKSVNPVKIYEYLAMGKPVLATKYEETIRFGDLIETYVDYEEFEIKLLELLKNNQSVTSINKKVKYAKDNSWDNRVNSLDELINRSLEPERK